VLLSTTGLVSYESAAPFGAVAAVGLLARPGRRSPLTTFVGGISYPFYLNHWLGISFHDALGRALHGGETLGYLAGFGIAFGLSSAHYWLVDRKLQELRPRWFSERRGRLAMTASFVLVATGFAVGLVLMAHPIP
jgi:peptidoglycan/LPS O-acetylase OafA/YrhL